MKIRIATRKSPLALSQTRWVKKELERHHPGIEVEELHIVTKGDRIQDRPLSQVGGKGLFVTEIEEALSRGEADLAVHSMKDVPAELAEGLFIACVPVREDARDVLVTKDGASLDDLEAFCKVGTSSLRRKAQLSARRNDIICEPVRGNVDTRLRKAQQGDYDAIVLAAAGVRRLGLEAAITEYLSFEVMLPAPGQGAYGLRFPANGDAPSGAYVAIQFLHPQLNGLPAWGAADQGTTFIWEFDIRQQMGYYVTFWWSRADGMIDLGTNAGSPYYGGHPYPDTGPGGTSATGHYWEVAHSGLDVTGTRSGSPLAVVKGRRYVQALRVVKNANGTKTMTFYIDLPSTAESNIITTTTVAGYGDNMASATHAVTFGDSPWYAAYQHERMAGTLRRVKIFNRALSAADMLTEASDFSAVKTVSGSGSIWWGKNGFNSTDDLQCSYGTGRTFSWANTANKATLETL